MMLILSSSRTSTSFLLLLFFFFSSRRRHTRFDCDWSSDVCSSDLAFVAVGARLGHRPPRRPQSLGALGQERRGVVRRIEVVTESQWLPAREGIAVGVFFRRHRSRERLEVGDEVDDLLRAQEADRPPGRHRRVWKEDPRIPDELIEILIRQLAVADGGLVGTDTAGRPYFVARNQMAPGARPLVPAEKERAALPGIAGHGGW